MEVKTMKRRILFLTLAGAMIFSFLAACGGGDSDGQQAFVEPPANWDDPYSTTIKINAASIMGVNWFFEDDDDINNNPWTRLYKDVLNIEVDFEFTAVADAYEERLNMAIAAGNLPDVFYIPHDADPMLFRNLAEAGMLLDLTDAYKNHASQRLRNHELIDPLTIQGYTIDGKIYGIPRYYYGAIDQPWHMWVRKDWYEAEGSPEIRTVADLERLARAFMDNHGAAYGIGAEQSLQWLFRTAPMFGAYIGNIHSNEYFWLPDSTGRLKPGISSPEFIVALENWARWFDEGLLSPEFPTFDPWGNAQEEVVNGRVGIHCWWQWWGWWGNAITELESLDSYFIPLNLPTLDGSKPANGQIFYPNMGAVVASADFNNPAALMKILSLNDHMIFSPDANLTPADIEYYMDDGREHAMTPTFQIMDPNADLLQFQHVLHALNTGDTSQLFTTGMKFKYTDSLSWRTDPKAHENFPNNLGAYLQMGFEGSAYGRSQHLFDNGWVVQTAQWGPAPSGYGAAGTPNDIIMEEVMNIIMGNRPASDWPSILQRWYDNGGQLIEDLINEHYG